MDSKSEIRAGGKKFRKRRDLDALIRRSMIRKSYNIQGGVNLQDKLLSASTDDPEDYNFPQVTLFSSKLKRKYLEYKICVPLLIVLGIMFSTGLMLWLYFNIRQEIYDYRKKVNEVTSASQKLPETFQKWHETTAFLLKNHTSLLLKIHEMQNSMDILRQNMSDCRDLFDAQLKYANVEKVVADFGAKIEALLSDVDGIKTHHNTVVHNQKVFGYNISTIETNLSKVSSLASEVAKHPFNSSKEIESIKLEFLARVNNIEKNLITVNDKLSQKSTFLNDELVRHKELLDGLLDSSQNITSHVKSIENALLLLKKSVANNGGSMRKLESKFTDFYNQSNMVDLSSRKYSFQSKPSPAPLDDFRVDGN